MQPFLRQKTNEEISNPALLHDILPTLGNLLSFDVLDVQVAAADALQQFAIGACEISIAWAAFCNRLKSRF